MESPESAPPPPAAESGFFANLFDIYFAPGEAFARMLRRPGFLVPLALHVALSLGFTAVWVQKTDFRAFMKARIEESPRAARIPPEQMEQIVSQQARVMAPFAWASGLLAPPILVFVLSGVFLFVFRFFYASELTFKQALAIVASGFAAFALLTTPLLLGVLFLKDDWTIPPQEAFQANATLLLEKSETAKPLYALLGSLDLLSFWLIFVLASGFAAASRRSWSWALAGIAVPWALYVLAKVGFAFAF